MAADPQEIRQFHNAKMMLFPVMLLEVCFLLSSSGGIFSPYHLHGHHMSFLVIVEYGLKTICYSTMAHWDGGLVHMNMRARGPPRACYTLRFLDWSIAVPILLAINNYPFASSQSPRQFAMRLAPNLILTNSYIVASWAAQVTPNATSGWFLVFLTAAAFFLSVVDQIAIVLELRKHVTQKLRFKTAVVVMKEFVFVAYGAIYLFGILDLVSALGEQIFYTYGDVWLKVVQASCLVMVRNWEDLAAIKTTLELQVLQGKEDMSRLTHNANAPIFSVDGEGRITAWNEHLVRASRIPEERALGTPLEDLAAEGCRGAIREALAGCRQGLSTGAVEVRLPSGAPEGHQAQLVVSFLLLQGPGPASIVAVGQDLTEVMAMKVLQERKARWAAVLSHELRSPLHGITGLSGALMEASTDPMTKKQLSMIQGCASRLLDLVTNMMEMAMSETRSSGLIGSPEVPKGEVNVMDVVDEVVELTRAAVNKSGKPLVASQLQLENELRTGKLPMVRGDACKIAQLLYNLVTNACKFTKKGRVAISCRHIEDKAMLELDVSDTGVGISPEAIDRIFEPFEQEDNKDSRSFHGVGLGLPVALGIAKSHGGTITVRSTVGQGSTFTVRLPCDNTNCAGPTSKHLPVEKQCVTPQQCATLRQDEGRQCPAPAALPAKPLLLSVDDDDVNQEVVERAVGDQYRVVRAMNGMEALAYLGSGKEMPSAVLLDVMMPGLTGFDVCNEIRKTMKHGHLDVPIVLLSARTPAETTTMEGFKCGATECISKPFSGGMLKMRLKVIMQLKREAHIIACQSSVRDVHPQAVDLKASPQADDGAVKQVVAGFDALKAERAALTDERDKLMAERDALKAQQRKLEAALAAAQEPPTAQEALAEQQAREEPGGSGAADAKHDKTAEDGSIIARLTLKTRSSNRPPFMKDVLRMDVAARDLVFLKSELAERDARIALLSDKLSRSNCDSWLQKDRAEAAERELQYVRRALSELLMSS